MNDAGEKHGELLGKLTEDRNFESSITVVI